MKVLILGGDGYLGWPTAMYFSNRGHDVMVADNYFRRNVSVELDCEPLIPTLNLIRRGALWKEISGKSIDIRIGDVTDYNFLISLFKEYQPDTVVHYAEQPSAPYSMMGRTKAAFTLQNNLMSTANIVHAVKEVNPDSLSSTGWFSLPYN